MRRTLAAAGNLAQFPFERVAGMTGHGRTLVALVARHDGASRLVGPAPPIPSPADCHYACGMDSKPPQRDANALVRSVALLQVKLLLDALRDIALSPLTLAAALVDLVRIKQHPPQYFQAVLRLGEKTDSWIDLWSGARNAPDDPRENVDKLLDRVEEIVRDPHVGARRARVLKRWAERQVTRARQRAAIAPPAGPPPRDAN